MSLHPLNRQTVSLPGSQSTPAAPKGRARFGRADHTAALTNHLREVTLPAATRSPRRKPSRSQPPASFAPAYGLPPLDIVQVPEVRDALSAVRNLHVALGSLEMLGAFGRQLALPEAYDANVLHSGLALLRSFDQAYPALDARSVAALCSGDGLGEYSRDYAAFALKQLQAAREAAPQVERQFLAFAVAHLRVSADCKAVLSELLRCVERRVAA